MVFYLGGNYKTDFTNVIYKTNSQQINVIPL